MKYLSSTNCCEKSTKSCQGEKEHLFFFYLHDGECVGDDGVTMVALVMVTGKNYDDLFYFHRNYRAECCS